MPNIGDLTSVPRMEWRVFFVIDTSESMHLEQLNRSMDEAIEGLKNVAKESADIKLMVSVLEFSSGCT